MRLCICFLILMVCSCQEPATPSIPASNPPSTKSDQYEYDSRGWLELQRGGKSYVLEIWHDTRDSAEMKLLIFEEGIPVIPAKPFQMKALDPVLDDWNMEPYVSPHNLKGAIGKPSKSTFLVAMNAAVYEIHSLQIGDADIGPIRFGYIGNPYRELNSDTEHKEFLKEFSRGVPKEIQRYDGRDNL